MDIVKFAAGRVMQHCKVTTEQKRDPVFVSTLCEIIDDAVKAAQQSAQENVSRFQPVYPVCGEPHTYHCQRA